LVPSFSIVTLALCGTVEARMKITDVLITEHRIFLSVFDQIEHVLPSLTTPTELRTMAAIIEGMLSGHAAAETNLAYLALDHVLAEKGQLERMHEDHHEIDVRLKKVHATNTCAEMRHLLKTAIQSSREHFSYEEKFVFPFLERKLQDETLTELGRTWLQRSPALQPVS